jgi:oxygen-independent coproporphyrinogen III oxidase
MNRLPAWIEPRAAYVHIPFCAHHCGYCDFAVSVGQDSLMPLYVDALSTELARLETPRPVDTIFIGGGTPTHLPIRELGRVLQVIQQWLPLNAGGEFSIESNPESLNAAICQILADAGVTRVSVGVQSFQSHLLKALDRVHRYEQIPQALDAVRTAGLELSLDLIFGAPGATLADWECDLNAAIKYETEHLSTYGLTYEKGTPLWKERERGRLFPVTEDDELAMYEFGIDRLASAGLEQYEVSNFAKVGHRCRHNEHYWANEAYYGFGVGAARYVNFSRELNVRNTSDYIRKMLAGDSVAFQSEMLAPLERAYETLAVQLRRTEGIHFASFEQQTGFAFEPLVCDRLPALHEQELLTHTESALYLTRSGRRLADAIIEDLLKAKPTPASRRPLPRREG